MTKRLTLASSILIALTFILAACGETTTQPTTYSVNVSITGSGSISSSPSGISCTGTCSADFSENAIVTLTATPADGFILDGWGGDCLSTTGNTCSLTMNGNKTVSAIFVEGTPLEDFDVAVNLTGDGTGSVTSDPAGITCGTTCVATFTEGTDVTLTATANAGSVFAGWSGDCSGSKDTCTFTVSDDSEVTARFNPEGLEIIESRISASSDDAEEFITEIDNAGEIFVAGRVFTNSSDLELTYDQVGTNQVVGLRFTNITLPKTATIKRAYIQFAADKKSDDAAPTLTIKAQAADNAGTFIDYTTDAVAGLNNISSRPTTTASVTWQPAAWSKNDAGVDQQTPDLKAVINEVTARPGWTPGNPIAFIITGPDDATLDRIAKSFDGSSKNAPLLVVEYE